MDPVTLIFNAAAKLQKPAGDDPKFSHFLTIMTNRKDFVLKCHKTWKELHGQATQQIMIFDAFDKREKEHPIGPPVKEFGDYQRAIWRRVNDSIIWSLFGMQRHVVKRLCLYRQRGHLDESNAESTIAMVDQLNIDPMSIAIWNDCTSCIDVGDVTFIKDGMNPVPAFYELKEGRVNETIIDILHKDADDIETKRKLAEFEREYGKHGMKQLKRVVRQTETNEQALSLLKHDKGVDPVSGRQIEVLDTKAERETYDRQLNELIKLALDSNKEMLELVGECIWIYVNPNQTIGRSEVRSKLQAKISDLNLRPAHSVGELAKHDRDRMVCLNESFYYPMAKPLFVRNINPEYIAHITNNALMYRVYAYVDWRKFEEVVTSLDVEFSWSTERQARRAQSRERALRVPVVGGRIPQIHVGEGRCAITDPNLVEMLFDGGTPRSVCQSIIETAKMIESGKVKNGIKLNP